MQNFIHQHERKLILLIGCLLIPAVFLVSLFIMEMPYENISGLLDDPVWHLPSHIVFLLMLAWLCFCLYRIGMKTVQKELVMYDLGVLALLAVIALALPYRETSQLISSLHIVAAYSAFIWMNILFYRYAKTETGMRNIYLPVVLFSFLHSLTYGAVTGVSEAVYGAAVSIMITILCARA